MDYRDTRADWIERNKQLFRRRGIFVGDDQLEVCYDKLKETGGRMPTYIDRRLVASQLWERLFAGEGASSSLSQVDWVDEMERLHFLIHEAGKWTPQLDRFCSFSQTEKMAMYQMLTDSEFYHLAPPDSKLVARFIQGETFSPHMEPARLSAVENARLHTIQV